MSIRMSQNEKYDISLKKAIHADYQVTFLRKGKEDFELLYAMKMVSSYNRNNYHFIMTIGTGAFGRVVLARSKKHEDKYYAIKTLSKERIVKMKQVQHVINERKVLQAINHPFTVSSVGSFQDHSYLYLVMPFVEGGEMFLHLRRMNRFNEDLSRFYAGQILMAIEYLHYCGLIYRDLKPENILIERQGYLKLTDFGFCKPIESRTYTLCGTPEYLAPEVILSKGYGMSVDWWSFGVLLYEMNAGFPPFHSVDQVMVYEKIVTANYSCPRTFSPDLRDLVTNLLQLDLSKRYGNLKNGVQDIKAHPWFQTVNWFDLFNRIVRAPFVPELRGVADAKNFDNFPDLDMVVCPVNRFSSIFDEF